MSKLTKVLASALQKQFKRELDASFMYLSMASWFDKEGLRGHANWMKIQSQEEMFHAMKFYDYLARRNNPAEVPEITKPEINLATPEEIFEFAFAREQEVTRYTQEICELANKEKDYAALQFIQWFAAEQVEEENLFDDIIYEYKLLATSPEKLYRMDTKLASRPAFVPDASMDPPKWILGASTGPTVN